jgi:hypothetical protein
VVHLPKRFSTPGLYQPDRSVVAEHSINFKDIKILARMVGYMDHIVKEAIEIWLHPNNFNRDTGFTLI